MKYVLVLGDGMADEPVEELNNRTPLDAAQIPYMDMLASKGELGMVQTVPEGMKPGSDTANLSVLGYDPAIYYSGRSPLEALSIGVDLLPTDVAIRCNLITVTETAGSYDDEKVVDHSAGEISTEDAAILLDAVRKELESDTFRFYTGTSYRHLLVWDHGQVVSLTGPHDVPGRRVGDYLPEEEALAAMMRKSYEILRDHPINLERKARGVNPANSIWFWGAGTRPALTSFEEKNRKKGVMISAVDLLKGIAVGAGMEVINVEGANGGLDTNYRGKADAALEALENGADFVYIHVEAPDEMGHQGDPAKKIQAIERIDREIVKTVYEKLSERGEEFRMLILPDHPTPIRVRTHTGDPVPYILYDSRKDEKADRRYTEKTAADGGIFMPVGHQLIDRLFENESNQTEERRRNVECCS